MGLEWQEPDEPVPPIDRPEPVSASTFQLFGVRHFQVIFNQTLVSMPSADIFNWSMVFAPFFWRATGVVIFGNRVQIRAAPGAPVPGPDRISYDPPPDDVRAQDDGAAALPFTDFPIT